MGSPEGADTQLGLTRRLTACLGGRSPSAIQTRAFVPQRVFGLACGYAHCNDAAGAASARSPRRPSWRASRPNTATTGFIVRA
jgi:hypothetical protein